jgi:ParB/RepB/Spo0J family partition protein
VTQTIEMIRTADIFKSNLNRDLSDEAQGKIEALASSMRENGLIQPITVRRVGEAFEIVCGERRWRAAKQLGWETMPCLVIEATDSTAHEMRLIENLQRLEIDPMAQSAGVVDLLAMHDNDYDEVARRIGVSQSWLRVRARLSEMSQRWRAEIASGRLERFRESVCMQELIARLPQAMQDEMLEQFSITGCRTVADLRRAISAILRRIAERPWAKWEKECAALKNCSRCKTRSDREDVLFEELVENSKDSRCLNDHCWNKQVGALIKWRFETEKAKNRLAVRLLSEGYVGSEFKNDPFGVGHEVFDSYDMRPPEDGEKANCIGLFVNGDKIGETEHFVFEESESDDDKEDDRKPVSSAWMLRTEALREIRRLVNEQIAERVGCIQLPELLNVVAAFGCDSTVEEDSMDDGPEDEAFRRHEIGRSGPMAIRAFIEKGTASAVSRIFGYIGDIGAAKTLAEIVRVDLSGAEKAIAAAEAANEGAA